MKYVISGIAEMIRATIIALLYDDKLWGFIEGSNPSIVLLICSCRLAIFFSSCFCCCKVGEKKIIKSQFLTKGKDLFTKNVLENL